MKNFWLKRATSIDSLIRKFQEDRKDVVVQEKLVARFCNLVQTIMTWHKIDQFLEDEIEQECVLLCFEKLAKYDAESYLASFYFTICVLSHLRQLGIKSTLQL